MPKILLLDLETAPAKVFTWGLWEQNIGTTQIVEDGYVLMWCAKWLHKKEVLSDMLINYPSFYKENPRSDKKIAESIWKLMDEADIIVTQNGIDFDLKWINTMFVKHGLKPVSPYKSVDTKRVLKSKFRFISNKLDFVGRKLGLGGKLSTGGFELWEGCLKGDKKCWDKMLKYCKNDVILLEKLYLKVLPFISNHPNYGLYSGVSDSVCPNCGCKSLERRGFEYTSTNKYQRYVCKKCGKWSRERKSIGKINVSGI